MATDAEIRGHILKLVYDLRHSNGGLVPLNDANLASVAPINLNTINMIAQHLADAGLIEWTPVLSGSGRARIRGPGVDVVEGTGQSSIRITLPKQEPSPTPPPTKPDAGSYGVQGFGGVAAKAEAGSFVVEGQPLETVAQIDARQQGPNAAVRSTIGAVDPILPPLAAPQMSFPDREATVVVPHTAIGVTVLQNRVQISITAASFAFDR